MIKDLWKPALACMFGLALTAMSTTSEAAITSMTCDGGIENIDFRQMSSTNSELLIGCRAASGAVTNMFTYSNSGVCTTFNQNLDTMKFWFTMASGWALASKKVQIYFDPSCGGQNRITAISLRR